MSLERVTLGKSANGEKKWNQRKISTWKTDEDEWGTTRTEGRHANARKGAAGAPFRCRARLAGRREKLGRSVTVLTLRHNRREMPSAGSEGPNTSVSAARLLSRALKNPAIRNLKNSKAKKCLEPPKVHHHFFFRKHIMGLELFWKA